MLLRVILWTVLLAAMPCAALAQGKTLLGQLREESLDELSDSQISALGRKALAIKPDDVSVAQDARATLLRLADDAAKLAS